MIQLVYLHGFLSSPLSSKAVATERWLAQHQPDWSFHCPALSSYPDVARDQISELLDRLHGQPIALLGSSLGGFWATGFAEQRSLPAVLINPAVAPHTRLHEFLGKPLRNYYTEEEYHLEPHHLQHFVDFDTPRLQFPENYWVMLQTGDETLDYRQALAKYAQCKITLEEGGNHSFAGYANWLPQISQFIAARLS